MPDKPQIQQLLGKAVKEVRASRAITQEELASRSGLHATYISDIERGARNPSFAVLVRLADGLGATLAEIGAAYDRQAGSAGLPMQSRPRSRSSTPRGRHAPQVN